MVTDQQVRRMMKAIKTEKSLSLAAAKAGMDEKTARRYRRSGKLPSEMQQPHTWRTRADPFEDAWEDVRAQLEAHPGLEAKTLFEDLQRRYPGRFPDGQLRTLQRRVKRWRALEGPQREVMFEQVHEPGALGQSDFTWMGSLGVTIEGRRVDTLPPSVRPRTRPRLDRSLCSQSYALCVVLWRARLCAYGPPYPAQCA